MPRPSRPPHSPAECVAGHCPGLRDVDHVSGSVGSPRPWTAIVEYGAQPAARRPRRRVLPSPRCRTMPVRPRSSGTTWLCANDHLVFSRPWLDGLTALSAVIDRSGDMTLATTVSLPVIRGPAVLAKALTALDVLSGGRVVAGVGPGSSTADYGLVGVPFEERWRRFDEALRRCGGCYGPRRRRGEGSLRPGPTGTPVFPAGATALGRQLGQSRGSAPSRRGRRRLDRLGVQRDAGALPGAPGHVADVPALGRAATPPCPGDDVDLRLRGPGRR